MRKTAQDRGPPHPAQYSMSILLAGSEYGDRKRGELSLQSRHGGEPVIGSDTGSCRPRILLGFRDRYIWSSPLTTEILEKILSLHLNRLSWRQKVCITQGHVLA
jgi:hypothetical protein